MRKMVTRDAALARLNKEKEYEDGLVFNLAAHFINCLEDIPGLADEEVQKIAAGLETIRAESSINSSLFDQISQMVFEHEHDTF